MIAHPRDMIQYTRSSKYCNNVFIISIYLSIYLSIFLYVLTPEGDIRQVPVNQVLGVSFFFFFFLCNVSCVSSE